MEVVKLFIWTTIPRFLPLPQAKLASGNCITKKELTHIQNTHFKFISIYHDNLFLYYDEHGGLNWSSSALLQCPEKGE